MAEPANELQPAYAAAPHPQEAERLAALRSTHLLDSDPSTRFDRITSLTADVFAVPIVLVSLVDQNRQWFLSRCGLDVAELPRREAFCAHALHEDELLVVEDAQLNPVFRGHPLVLGEPFIRFYAGAVLRDNNGLPLGTLCLVDQQPRRFDYRDRRRLLGFAELVRQEMLQGGEASYRRTRASLDAQRDPITNAYWGSAFFTCVERARRRQTAQSAYLLILLRVNNLEILNDSFGRIVGDEILLELASRLRGCIGDLKDCTVGRLDGGQLVALLQQPDSTEDDRQQQLVERLATCIAGPVRTSVAAIEPQISLVTLCEPEGLETVRNSVRMTQIAASRLPHKPGLSAMAVTEVTKEQSRNRFELVRDLTRAIADSELRLAYQPKVDSFSGEVRGFECLLRWQHPKLGFVSPLEIMEIARESNQTLQLEQWVFRNAAAQVGEWRGAGYEIPSLSLNLTGTTLLMPEFPDWLCGMLSEYAVDPAIIDIEVVESSVFEEFALVVEAMNRIRGMGITFSLDDFGTGFSNLSYLRQLPVSTLKIDKSFIDDIVDDQEAAALCSGIISMARNLGMASVAEGVETELQHVVLRALRCDLIQGYLFAKPMAAADVPGRITVAGQLLSP